MINGFYFLHIYIYKRKEKNCLLRTELWKIRIGSWEARRSSTPWIYRTKQWSVETHSYSRIVPESRTNLYLFFRDCQALLGGKKTKKKRAYMSQLLWQAHVFHACCHVLKKCNERSSFLQNNVYIAQIDSFNYFNIWTGQEKEEEA
jgi:hypothetical protein